MARWSVLLSKVWIHSSLIHLPLEVEGHAEWAARILLAVLKLRSPNSSVDEEEERQAKKHAYLKKKKKFWSELQWWHPAASEK